MYGWQLARMDVNKKVWIASGAYGCEQKCLQNFHWEAWTKETTWKAFHLDGSDNIKIGVNEQKCVPD